MRQSIRLLPAFAVSLAVACGSSGTTPPPDASTTACVPGDQKACACAGGGAGGTQVCSADGSGYGTCTGCSGRVDGGHDAGHADASHHRDGSGGNDATTDTRGTDTSMPDSPEDSPAEACALSCSTDGTAVVDCHGMVSQQCPAMNACDPVSHTCIAACQAAVNGRTSVGCDFYATNMELDYANECFAAYVVNAGATPVHIRVDYELGAALTVPSFGRIPSGVGSSVTYTPYDAIAGVPVGQAAILFLSGSASSPNAPCPAGVVTAAAGSLVQGTGTTQSFHISTDAPVSVFQMNPYGGGSASIPGASMLLPTSAWDTNYLLVTAAPYSSVTMDTPSLNIVASQDDTQVTILPSVAIVGGGTLPAGPANMPYQLTLSLGQQVQLSQQADLTGSILQSTSPIGVMAGNGCMQVPVGTSFCDHGEQMLPPVQAVGSEYAAVMFRPRVTGDMAVWRLVGLVNGTNLTYSTTPPGAPATLSAGQQFTFITDQPFTVASQDSAHPFALFANMTGGEWSGLSDTTGYGDPEFVVVVPPAQFLTSYSFYADPLFPESNLVVVRAKDASGQLDDVKLDCAGTLTGWQPVGSYEWTRIDLLRHDFVGQGNCSAGAHTMSSAGPFGVTVWGWGSPETTMSTTFVSYGYPAGMSAVPINTVVIAPTPQ